MTATISVLIFTLLLFALVERGTALFEKIRKQKYYREYMQAYRERKRREAARILREWRGKTIKVNDFEHPYLIVRTW